MRSKRIVKNELAIDFLLDDDGKIAAYCVYYNLQDMCNNDTVNIIPIPLDSTEMHPIKNNYLDFEIVFSQYSSYMRPKAGEIGIYRAIGNSDPLCIIASGNTLWERKITIGDRTVDVAYCLDEAEDDFVYKWRSKTSGVNLITSKAAPQFK